MIAFTSLVVVSGFAASALAAPSCKLEVRSQEFDLETREPRINVARIGHFVNRIANAAQNTANVAATVGSVIPQRQTAQYYRRDFVDDSELELREPSILSAALRVSHAVDSLTHHHHRRDLANDKIEARELKDVERGDIDEEPEAKDLDEDKAFEAHDFDEEELDVRHADKMEEAFLREDEGDEDVLARELDAEYYDLD